jgi:hypothetical protein
MTPFDDDDLIERLQSGIAERQSDVYAPPGIGEQARRAARKRTVVRAVGAGVPLLVAAGVATVLVTGADPGSTAARDASAGGSALSAPTGSVRAQDTAYIVERVKANVAASAQDGTSIHDYAYTGGRVSADGSFVDLGWKLADVYDYTAPDATEYSREVMYREDGSTYLTMAERFAADGTGRVSDAQTIINPRDHVYSQTWYPGTSGRQRAATPTLFRSPSEVRQALQSGQVTQKGTATVSGSPAIALSVMVPSSSTVAGDRVALYVDAQTYQPLRTVTAYDGLPDLEVADWVPVTAETIAEAENDSTPAGYTKVDKARVGH